MIRRFACIVWFILFATPVAAAGLMKTGAVFHPTSVALGVVMLQPTAAPALSRAALLAQQVEQVRRRRATIPTMPPTSGSTLRRFPSELARSRPDGFSEGLLTKIPPNRATPTCGNLLRSDTHQLMLFSSRGV